MEDLSAYQSLTKLLLDCILYGDFSGRNVACLLYEQLFASSSSLYFFLHVMLFFRRKLKHCNSDCDTDLNLLKHA